VSASSDAAATAVLEVTGQPVPSIPLLRHQPVTNWSIVLHGLTKPLAAGTFISVTLVFEKAPRTTLQVPIRAGDNGLGVRTPLQNPYGEGKP
jgi:hypothetical protein